MQLPEAKPSSTDQDRVQDGREQLLQTLTRGFLLGVRGAVKLMGGTGRIFAVTYAPAGGRGASSRGSPSARP